MTRKKPAARAEFVSFDVFYEDGTQTSNRRVPAELIGTYEGDQPVIAFLAEQDREIGEKSGRPRAAIKGFKKSGMKKAG